jgi:hypothetical protein
MSPALATQVTQACTSQDTIPTHRPLYMHLSRREEALHRLFRRPRQPPDPTRLIGPLWVSLDCTQVLLRQVEQLIADISPQGRLLYQARAPPPQWWHCYDQLWTQWTSLAQSELYRNQGFTAPVGTAPQFVDSTPKNLVRIFRRQADDRPWGLHLRALQEAAAAIRSGHSPPGYTRDWPRWTRDRLKALHRLAAQGRLDSDRLAQDTTDLRQRPLGSLLVKLQDMLPRVHELAVQEDHSIRQDKGRHWEAKLAQAFQAGTGWAHRLSKPQEHPPLPTHGPQRSTSLADQLQAQEEIWHSWWQVGQTLPQGDFCS